MLIVGTGGMGKEVLGLLVSSAKEREIYFFDQDKSVPNKLFGKYPVLKLEEDVANLFKEKSCEFIVGIGQPRIRERLTLKMETLGGELASLIRSSSFIFPFNKPSIGLLAHPGVGVSHGADIGKSCVLHINSTIGHDVILGKFVSIGPNSSIIGPSSIGDYGCIGANATILPGIKIGKNVVIGAGSIIDRNIDDNETIVGLRQ